MSELEQFTGEGELEIQSLIHKPQLSFSDNILLASNNWNALYALATLHQLSHLWQMT